MGINFVTLYKKPEKNLFSKTLLTTILCSMSTLRKQNHNTNGGDKS